MEIKTFSTGPSILQEKRTRPFGTGNCPSSERKPETNQKCREISTTTVQVKTEGSIKNPESMEKVST